MCTLQLFKDMSIVFQKKSLLLLYTMHDDDTVYILVWSSVYTDTDNETLHFL